MFGRDFTGKGHRQHVLPPNPTGYGFERVGSTRQRTANAFGELMDFLGDSFSGQPSVADVKEYLQFERDYPSPHGGSVSNLAEELENYFGYDLSEFRTGSRRTASGWQEDYDGTWFVRLPGDVVGSLTPSDDPETEGTYTASAEVDRDDDTRVLLHTFGVSLEEGKRLVEQAAAQVSASRTAGWEELDSNVWEYHIPAGPTVQIKNNYWEVLWGTNVLAEGGETTPENAILEAIKYLQSEGITVDDDLKKVPFLGGPMDHILGPSRPFASRESSHHLAFFDGIDLPEPQHRVAGWDWDDHLNGFLAAEAAREFTCSCGANVPAPGYTDCHCGKRWNAYVISANGSQKMIAREVPVRDGVVMAGRTASLKVARDTYMDELKEWQPVEYDVFMESLSPGTVYEPGELEVLHKKWVVTQDPFDEGGDSMSDGYW